MHMLKGALSEKVRELMAYNSFSQLTHTAPIENTLPAAVKLAMSNGGYVIAILPRIPL